MIEALGHRLTIKPDKAVDSEADKTKQMAEKAGFVLPATTKDELTSQALRDQASVDQGVIMTIGKTAFRDFGGEAWAEVGDYVAFARGAGKYLKDPETGEYVVVINDEDCIARITPKKED